jgi:hypothetical protein
VVFLVGESVNVGFIDQLTAGNILLHFGVMWCVHGLVHAVLQSACYRLTMVSRLTPQHPPGDPSCRYYIIDLESTMGRTSTRGMRARDISPHIYRLHLVIPTFQATDWMGDISRPTLSIQSGTKHTKLTCRAMQPFIPAVC